MKRVSIRQAGQADTVAVSQILREAAGWLASRGTPLWRDNELLPEKVEAETAAGHFWIAEVGGDSAGCVRLQLEDPQFWPEIPPGTSAYIHRLAIRRAFAGGTVSTALIDFAVQQTRNLGLTCLRLDCEAASVKLRAFYERYGFRKRDEREIGPYRVARYELVVTSARSIR